MGKIMIRFDDICPTMDFEQWERAEKILRKYQIKPLIGVIPACEDPDLQINSYREDFWTWIKSLQKDGYYVAMHGVHHRFKSHQRGMIDNRSDSEFAGLTCEEQYQLIMEGKRILEEKGIRTDVFFAPAHSYDRNTIRALSRAGFKYMSDGKSRRAYRLDGLICLPTQSYRMFQTLGGHYTAIFHAHEWVKPEKAKDYDELHELCQRHRDEIVDFDEYRMQKTGFAFIERTWEKVIVGYYRYLKPWLAAIKRVAQ